MPAVITTFNNGDSVETVRNAILTSLTNLRDEVNNKEDTFTKKTGFNLDLGVVSGTVAEGNHTHAATGIVSGVLASARGGLGVDASGFTGFLKITAGVATEVAFGTSAGTVAEGDHVHTAVYEAKNTNIQEHIAQTTTAHGLTIAQVAVKNTANVFTAQQTFNEAVKMVEKSADPTKPAEGEAVLWMSDGTGLGDDGDVIVASTAGGVTNYTVVFDHSAGTVWS